MIFGKNVPNLLQNWYLNTHRLDQNFDFRPKFQRLAKFQFLTKTFDQNVNVSICDQKFYFLPKFIFLTINFYV